MELRRIIAVRVSPPDGDHPLHITDFKWVDQDGKRWHGPRSEMVRFVGSHPEGSAYTDVSGSRANLHVVSHWVETEPDDTKRDNLLSLERF